MVSKITAPTKTPIRPKQKVDEWIETYLVRIARANGLPFPSADDISRLKGVAEHHDSTLESDPSCYLRNLPTWTRKKQSSPIRYCPACFQEDRFVRARWRLTKFEMCTIHHIYLKTGVVEPALAATLNYPKALRLNEIDDAQLWDGATCPLPREKMHALSIWADFERSALGDKQQLTREYVGWAIVAEEVLDAVISAGVGPEIPIPGESRLCHAATWLAQNGQTITPSQEGIVTFLTSIKTHRERRAAGRRLRYMIKENATCSTLLDAIPLQYLHDRLLATAPETYCPVTQGSLPAHYQPEGYISLNYAESLLGRDTNFVHYLVRANFFERVKKVRFRHRVYFFVHQAEIEACRRWLSECMTPKQLIKHLHIDRKQYMALKRRAVLRPFVIGLWAFHRIEDISALTLKLEDAACLITNDPTQVLPLFGNWLIGPGSVNTVFAAIFDEILLGRLKLFRDPNRSGLSAYYVDATAEVRARELSACMRNTKSISANQLLLSESAC